jgi:hypothetical protein
MFKLPIGENKGKLNIRIHFPHEKKIVSSYFLGPSIQGITTSASKTKNAFSSLSQPCIDVCVSRESTPYIMGHE